MFPWDRPEAQSAAPRGLPAHSRYVVDARHNARRAQERQTADLQSKVKQASTLHLQATSNERADQIRRRAESLRMAGESMLDAQVERVRVHGHCTVRRCWQRTWLTVASLRATAHRRPWQERTDAEHRRRQMAQDEALATELARRKKEEERRLREIQRICEQDESLRDLQEKLKVRDSGKAGQTHARANTRTRTCACFLTAAAHRLAAPRSDGVHEPRARGAAAGAGAHSAAAAGDRGGGGRADGDGAPARAAGAVPRGCAAARGARAVAAGAGGADGGEGDAHAGGGDARVPARQGAGGRGGGACGGGGPTRGGGAAAQAGEHQGECGRGRRLSRAPPPSLTSARASLRPQKFIDEYMHQLAEHRERMRREREEEEARIAEYARQKAAREAAEVQRKAEANMQAERIYHKACAAPCHSACTPRTLTACPPAAPARS